MAKEQATVDFKLCDPSKCSTDGRCPARKACEKRVLKQDGPGETPYLFGPCVACGTCITACPLGAITLK